MAKENMACWQRLSSHSFDLRFQRINFTPSSGLNPVKINSEGKKLRKRVEKLFLRLPNRLVKLES